MGSNSDEINKHNSWDSVRETREQLTKSEDYPFLDGLEQTWKIIQQDYGSIIKRDDDEGSAETPLNSFMYLVEMGFYPPPEVLLEIFNCFNLYYMAQGSLELEDVFFGKRKKGIGNHAAQKSQDWIYQHLWMNEQMESIPSIKPKAIKSISLIASEMLDHFKLDELDLDSFLRGYRRWKSRKIKNHQEKVLQDFIAFAEESEIELPDINIKEILKTLAVKK